MSSLKFTFDTRGINAALDNIAKTAEEAVRPAAQAGAQMLYDEARAQCPVSDNAHFFYGTSFKKTGQRYFFKSGTLRNSIYQVYSKDNSSKAKATYHIAWNHQKAPYGFMVEYGTSRAPAHPFLRPAYEVANQRALQAAEHEYATRMAGVIR